MVGATLCGNVGKMTLCDEVGRVDGTTFSTADGVEDGVQRGVGGVIEGGGGVVLGTCDGLLGGNNVNTV